MIGRKITPFLTSCFMYFSFCRIIQRLLKGRKEGTRRCESKRRKLSGPNSSSKELFKKATLSAPIYGKRPRSERSISFQGHHFICFEFSAGHGFLLILLMALIGLLTNECAGNSQFRSVFCHHSPRHINSLISELLTDRLI